jgi:hypothetical protein
LLEVFLFLFVLYIYTARRTLPETMTGIYPMLSVSPDTDSHEGVNSQDPDALEQHHRTPMSCLDSRFASEGLEHVSLPSYTTHVTAILMATTISPMHLCPQMRFWISDHSDYPQGFSGIAEAKCRTCQRKANTHPCPCFFIAYTARSCLI